MLWLRLPWSVFSVVTGYAPIEAEAVFLRLDARELVAMGDRREMLEYGRRFYPMQSRNEEGMVSIKWPAPLVTVSATGEDYLYGDLGAATYLLDRYTVGRKVFWAYDFPDEINDLLLGATEIEDAEPLLSIPPNWSGWCEAYLDMEGETRWRWGSDYPQAVHPMEGQPNNFLEFMQQQTPFISDTALLTLLNLEDWPTGDERWLRRMEPL